MARTRTRQEMRDQARVLADAVDSTNTSDSEANTLLNQEIASLWDMLVDAQPTRYSVTTTLTTTSGTLSYDFADGAAFSPTAADFMAILGVDYIQGTTRKSLDRFDFNDRDTLSRELPFDSYPGSRVRYDVRGQGVDGTDTRLVFDRSPISGPVYEVHYVQAAPELASDVATFDGINGWEDFPVYGLAILMMQREESDPSVLMAKRMEIRERILKLASKRDVGRSSQVASVWSRRRNRTVGLRY